MNDDYCSSVKMESIVRKLENLHISQYKTDDISEQVVLKALAKEVRVLALQAPQDCRTNRYKKEMLYDGTNGRDWALQTTSSSSSMNLSYQPLLLELKNVLQQFKNHHNYIRMKMKILNIDMTKFKKQILLGKCFIATKI